jgi:hypothetical protein
MKQISGIKTREDAIAAVAAIEVPDTGTRDASLTDAVKALALSRLAVLPPEVKVVGLEIRADTGDIELISIRIISHK